MNIVSRPNLSMSHEMAKELLLGMIAMRDPETVHHCYDVASIACAIGRAVNLDEVSLFKLHYAAILHDIGKQAIPKSVLSKPGKLTPAEFHAMKTHVASGVALLEQVDFDADIIRYIREHHERVDGSGYPKGLSGSEISLCGQIVGLADAISAMSSKSPYRVAMSIAESLNTLAQEDPPKFDKHLIEVARNCLDERMMETVAEY